MSFLYLAVEDELSFAVGAKLIRSHWGDGAAIHELRNRGNGYLRHRISNFNEMGRRNHIVVITDLDGCACAPLMISQWWNSVTRSSGMIFRVAIREVEAWIMADSEGLARYLGISKALMPRNPDECHDPKAYLIQASRRAKRPLRQAIVPDNGSRAKQGLGYNNALISFVESSWSIRRAVSNSDSLRRANLRLKEASQTPVAARGF